jgi:acetyl esterase/lipase
VSFIVNNGTLYPGSHFNVVLRVSCVNGPRPDFVAPIYLQYEWVPKSGGVPADAPPMFIAAASDDQLGLASHSVSLYQNWTAAKKPAELHLFSKGGHGFGMRKQNIPTDHWIERFYDWLEVQGLVKK